MSAVLAPRPWTAAARPASGAAPGGDADGRRWVFGRNCSLAPRQVGLFYASLCAVSLGIGVLFAAHGAPFVLGFAGLELLAVALALGVWARHAGDRETLTLHGRCLTVERASGTRVERTVFDVDRLVFGVAPGGLIRISGRGRTLDVGRFLRADLRAPLADEIRRAVHARAAGAS